MHAVPVQSNYHIQDFTQLQQNSKQKSPELEYENEQSDHQSALAFADPTDEDALSHNSHISNNDFSDNDSSDFTISAPKYVHPKKKKKQS